jgi:cytoskeleton protein RodZ
MSESFGPADSGDVAASPDAGALVQRPDAGPATAGRLLREARQARGLHIAALAASIKVTTQKLEALEGDRFDELPGATFTRALAQTVCRALKIDAAPVLALMPQSADKGLDRMSRTLNEPFRDRPGRRIPRDLSALRNPAVIGTAIVLLAIVGVFLLPAGALNVGSWFSQGADTRTDTAEAGETAEPAAPVTVGEPQAPSESASAEPALTSSPMIETVYAAPPADAAASSAEGAASAAVRGALQVRATGESWIEVKDRQGATLLSRLLQAGETVSVDGSAPLRVTVGNASVTTLTYQGQPVSLQTSRNSQVARVDLQ